jgi:hypothetical protein
LPTQASESVEPRTTKQSPRPRAPSDKADFASCERIAVDRLEAHAPSLIPLLTILVHGCATVGPPSYASKETMLSRRFEPHRISSRILVTSKQFEGDDALIVGLNDEWQCFDNVREVVRTTTVKKSEAQNLGVDVAGALIGVAAGAILLAAAPSLSSMKGVGTDGQESLSPREQAQTWAVLAFTGGAVFAGNLLRVGVMSRPEVIRSETSARVTRSERGRYACGADPATGGTVIAIVNDRSVDLPATSTGGKLRIALRAPLDELCGASDVSPSDMARVVFRPSEQPEVPLARIPLSDCVTSAKARSNLREAHTLVRQPHGSSLLRAIDQAGQAEKLLKGLPDRSTAKAELRSDLEAVRGEIESSMAKLTDDGLGALFSRGTTSGDDLVREGSAALMLAAKRPGPARVWQNTMHSISERVGPGAQGYLQMVAIVKRAGLNDCLINGWECPDWLTNEAILAATQRLTAEFVRGASTNTKQIASASRALGRTLSLKSDLAAETALDDAKDWIQACSSENEMQVKGVRAACADLLATVADAQKVIDANADAISRLKAEAAQRERDARQKKALREWKGQFARCRKLGAALPEAERLREQGRCNGECQEALGRMKKDLERLSQFQGDSNLDESTMVGVRRDCQAAGCPNCP